MIEFFVEGRPAPKGSFRVVTQRKGRRLMKPRVLKDSAKTYEWEEAVGWYARSAWRGPPFDEPLSVELNFVVARPKAHYGKRGVLPSAPLYPAVAPDLDKLVRATLDGMEGIVFVNDSRVVCLSASKRYGLGDARTGCRVAVEHAG